MTKITVLGAGLAGLSVSYHIGHERCVLFEKNHYSGGHIRTETVEGFTWDEGPHLSFTKYEYVKELFAESVGGEYLEYPVETGNYFQGNWIPHPAQTNLHAVPDPLRSACLEDFLSTRAGVEEKTPANYEEWLHLAFGSTFADTFPAAYTRKYWTLPPELLTTDWVGERVYFPSVEDVTGGATGPLPEQTHYIKSIRYPETGGYISYARKLMEGADVRHHHEMVRISFADRQVLFSNGLRVPFEILVNTLPLPELIHRSDAPKEVQDAATQLSCSSLLVVNVTADHPTRRPENWFYVYDEDKYTTRVNCTEKLSPMNAPPGTTGVQVEVYGSKFRPFDASPEVIADRVCDELVEMGVVDSRERITGVHTKLVPYANVIFDQPRREALDTIFRWLEGHGLVREDDDLDPTTDWDPVLDAVRPREQTLFLAGRYAQWKYYWTDDCVLQGVRVARELGAGTGWRSGFPQGEGAGR